MFGSNLCKILNLNEAQQREISLYKMDDMNQSELYLRMLTKVAQDASFSYRALQRSGLNLDTSSLVEHTADDLDPSIESESLPNFLEPQK